MKGAFMMIAIDFLSDETEQTSTRFVTFITPKMNRFDLAVTTTERFYGKKLVTDLQRGITAIVGPDDVEDEGVLQSVFQLNDEEADELRHFLAQVIGPVQSSDL